MSAELAAQVGVAAVEAGMQHAFGIVGSGPSLTLAEQVTAAGATFHAVGHEAAAVMMADGAWRAGGAVSMAVMIKGPGLASAVPGLAHCRLEQRPVLTAAEAYGPDDDSRRMHKRIDHHGLIGGVVKGHVSGDAATDMARLVAFAAARPSGPVHLDLIDSPSPSLPSERRDPVRPDDALARINGAERPALVTGRGTTDQHSVLGDLRIPVFTTVAAKGAVDEDLPHAAGVFTGVGGPETPEAQILAEADLLVTAGVSGEELLSAGLPPGTLELDDLDTETIDALRGKEWDADVVARRRRLHARLDAHRWWPGTPFAVLDDVRPDDALACDTGSFCTAAEHRWPARPGRPFVASGNARWMGAAIPLAIGHAVAAPGPIVCAVGDGGMRGYPGELKLAVAEGLPICVLLLRDGVYSSVAQARGRQPSSCAPAVIAEPSWWRAAEGMGWDATEVTDADGLASALSGWDGRTPRFIECGFDADWDPAPLQGVR